MPKDNRKLWISALIVWPIWTVLFFGVLLLLDQAPGIGDRRAEDVPFGQVLVWVGIFGYIAIGKILWGLLHHKMSTQSKESNSDQEST